MCIPRFKTTAEFDLAQVLAAMGMTSAFDPARADFSQMNGKRDLFLLDVLHNAFVSVNEEGTEAAATVLVGVGGLGPETPPPVFRADHPFVYAIRDNLSGAILFLGRLADPSHA